MWCVVCVCACGVRASCVCGVCLCSACLILPVEFQPAKVYAPNDGSDYGHTWI